MRNSLFISHSNPTDNEFTKWLALKLIGLGYNVWCDLLFLKKGADFWIRIEKEIRKNSCKFLLVTSAESIQKDGVLQELAVASKVKRSLSDDTFIVPLIIDENLNHSDTNIEIVRLTKIDFVKSWASGLRDLLSALDDQQVPKNLPDLSKSNALYQQIFLYDKGAIDKEEVYDSNWFPIVTFPEELRFHAFGFAIPKKLDTRTLTFPVVPYKKHLCTFAWEYDFMHQLPNTEIYDSRKTVRIPTSKILSGEYESEFIKNAECQRLIVQLINLAFEMRMKEKAVRTYQMSNSIAYWIEKGKLEKDKFEKVQLIGKQLDKNWHFGISGAGKLYPTHALMVSSRIVFTEDGTNVIESKSRQHAARRKQGKNWWNDAWREKLMAFVKYLSDDSHSFYLEMGSEEKITISNEPLKFVGKKSYLAPNENRLEEEAELSDINGIDQIENEFIEREE